MYTFCYWIFFRNSHPPQKKNRCWKKLAIATSVASCFSWIWILFSTHPGKTKSPEIFGCVFLVTLLRSSDYMSVKIWPPMLPICQDWTCLGGQVLRCFCWQSGACRVTLPQTTLCFCWSCFGWYVIEKQKKHGFVSCLWLGYSNILTTHNVRTWWFFSAIFWGLKPQGLRWRFGWTWSDAF